MEITGVRADFLKGSGEIFQALDEDVDYPLLVLQAAVGDVGGGGAGDCVETVPDVHFDDQVGNAGFVFEGDEGDSFGGAGALTHQDQAGDAHEAAVANGGQLSGGDDAELIELAAEERDGVGFERQAGGAVVGEDFLLGGH